MLKYFRINQIVRKYFCTKNFTIRAWWALIEQVAPRAVSCSSWLAAARRSWLVVLEATTFTKIYGQQRLEKSWSAADAIAADGRFAARDPLGSGSPLMGFR